LELLHLRTEEISVEKPFQTVIQAPVVSVADVLPSRPVVKRNGHAKPVLRFVGPNVNDSQTANDASTVRDRNPLRPVGKTNRFTWIVENGAAANYRSLGKRLAISGDLFRHGDGHALIQVLADGKTRLISKGSHLAPVIVDRMKMLVTKGGKVVSELPASNHLNAMLRSEKFLGQFRSVDEVTTHPLYRDDFILARPGYNDGGPGQRILYLGPTPTIADSTATIERFLDVMVFATTADRTNTVAAALTVLLHRHWRGQKPLVLVTSTKSHSGKGTTSDFFRGSVPKADLLYEANDWPMMFQFQQQIKANPEIGVVVFDNVRVDSSGRAKFIRSAFIESFVTSAEVTLASPGAGDPIQLENRYVVTINTNDGKLSPDLMNRALPIHLAPRGSVHERQTPIGNPKLDFLPAHQEQIEAELRGMIERWKDAGRPLDEDVKHSMSNWAKVIGGILKVSGFADFLGNCKVRKAVDDPVQEALAILGAAKPGKALRPAEWAKIMVEEGLVKTLLPPNERDTEKSRTRATGVLFHKHLDTTFIGRSDTTLYHLRLEGGNRRWITGKNPHVRYLFTVVKEEPLPVEDGDEPDTPSIGDSAASDRGMTTLEKKFQLYQTPHHITEALLRRETFTETLWEPCCGRGDIALVLRKNGYRDVNCSDIEDWGHPGTVVQDFRETNEKVASIVTNPPHGRPQEFVRHARKLANKVAMLLSADFEAAVGSSDLRADAEFRLKAVYTFTQSVRWLNITDIFGKIKYAWFVWEKGYSGETFREWITFDTKTLTEVEPLTSNAEALE
jgi:hypothetical protein